MRGRVESGVRGTAAAAGDDAGLLHRRSSRRHSSTTRSTRCCTWCCWSRGSSWRYRWPTKACSRARCRWPRASCSASSNCWPTPCRASPSGSARRLLAPQHYLAIHRTWGPSRLHDQQLGGAIVWFLAETIDLPVLALLVLRWIRTDEREAVTIDRSSTSRSSPRPLTDSEADLQRPWWETDATVFGDRRAAAFRKSGGAPTAAGVRASGCGAAPRWPTGPASVPGTCRAAGQRCRSGSGGAVRYRERQIRLQYKRFGFAGGMCRCGELRAVDLHGEVAPVAGEVAVGAGGGAVQAQRRRNRLLLRQAAPSRRTTRRRCLPAAGRFVVPRVTVLACRRWPTGSRAVARTTSTTTPTPSPNTVRVGDRPDLAGAALLADPGAGMARLFRAAGMSALRWLSGESSGARVKPKRTGTARDADRVPGSSQAMSADGDVHVHALRLVRADGRPEFVAALLERHDEVGGLTGGQRGPGGLVGQARAVRSTGRAWPLPELVSRKV